MKILTKDQCRKFIDLAVKRLAEYLIKNNLRGVTTGVSGGIDSAVVALIGWQTITKLNQQGYRADYKYLFLDCESNKKDLEKAKIFSFQFNIKLEQIDLTDWYRASPLINLIDKNHPQYRRALGNIKARLRMITLYQTALMNNFIYLDTDDLSEHWLGFWTRHGDEGDLKIIQSVTKTEVYDLGEYLGLPKIILNSHPADGLMVTPNSLAEEQLKLPYLYIDYLLGRFIGAGFDYNGDFNQLNQLKFKKLITLIAKEVNKTKNDLCFVLNQCLKTAYKRRYGDYAVNLMSQREEFGFFPIGSKEYNKKYLAAIINYYGQKRDNQRRDSSSG